MSIIKQIEDVELGASMFTALAQITRLFYEARLNDSKWSYEISKLQAPDGSFIGKSFNDGCNITIRIEPQMRCHGPAVPVSSPSSW